MCKSLAILLRSLRGPTSSIPNPSKKLDFSSYNMIQFRSRLYVFLIGRNILASTNIIQMYSSSISPESMLLIIT